MSNMCRDEISATLKQKLDGVFGSSFNTNGLGGVLTCGVTGVKAGLSHSPVSEVGPSILLENAAWHLPCIALGFVVARMILCNNVGPWC